MIVTIAWLKDSAYKGCGWKREQIKILGERYPLDGNWMARCEGKYLSDEDAKKFEELGKKPSAKKFKPKWAKWRRKKA